MRLTLATAAIGLAFGLPTLAQASGTATIYQSGVDNYGSIEQEATVGTSASIQQIGNRNTAGLPESGGVPAVQGVRQYNETSSAVTVYQFGNDNRGFVTQENGSGNTIRLWQGPNVVSYGNQGWVIQNASTNSFAEVYQDRASYNSGYVQQSGSNNDGRLVQGNWRWDGFAAGFTRVDIAAANSNASMLQLGDNLRAVIDQLGSNQSASSSQYGTWNDAGIMQEGAGNTASVWQVGTGASATDRNTAIINQNGTGFFAGITQYGHSNTALITQH